MRISDLIEDLQMFMDQHGDLEVVDDEDGAVVVEYNEDGPFPVIVIS
jgi:hypothetical protein